MKASLVEVDRGQASADASLRGYKDSYGYQQGGGKYNGAGHALRSGLSLLSYRCNVESISLIQVKKIQHTDTAKSKEGRYLTELLLSWRKEGPRVDGRKET